MVLDELGWGVVDYYGFVISGVRGPVRLRLSIAPEILEILFDGFVEYLHGRKHRMSRYSVTIKIIHTWYEDIVVEAASEDGAEIAALAQIESVNATGEPTVDRYAYCNWMIEDTEPTPDEVDAMERANAPVEEAGSEIAQPARKRSRRRSRRRKSAAVGTEEQGQEAVAAEVETEQEAVPAETQEEGEAVVSEEVVVKPSRSRNRRRRRSRSAAAQAETPIVGESPVDVETIELSAVSAEEIVETPAETGVQAAEAAVVPAPTRSRSRRRRRSKPASPVTPESPTEEIPSVVETQIVPESPVIAEIPAEIAPTPSVEKAEEPPIPAKPRTRGRRKPKAEEQATVESVEAEKPAETPARVVEEQAAPAAMESVPEVAPVKPRRRRKPKTEASENAETSESEKPAEPAAEAEIAQKPKPRRRRKPKTEAADELSPTVESPVASGEDSE